MDSLPGTLVCRNCFHFVMLKSHEESPEIREYNEIYKETVHHLYSISFTILQFFFSLVKTTSKFYGKNY